MKSLRFDRILDAVAGMQWVWAALWVGLVLITVALLTLLATRWGQSRLLQKCVVLSLLTHLLLATYATTVEIVAAGRITETVMQISDVDVAGEEHRQGDLAGASATNPQKPWEKSASEAAAEPDSPDLDRPPDEQMTPAERAALDTQNALPADARVDALPTTEAERPEAMPIEQPEVAREGTDVSSEPLETPSATRREAADPLASSRPGAARNQTPVANPGVARPGAMSTLIGPAAPPPRLTDLPASPAPAEAVASLTDVPSRSSSPLAPETDSTGPAGEASPGAGRMRTGPSVAAAITGGAGDVGSPDGGAASSLLLPRVGPRRPGVEGGHEAPGIYQLRRAPQKARVAKGQGGSAATEAAVKAALHWLALNQEPDGRWDASKHGGGRGQDQGDVDRKGAGGQADTGVTGLALLAFLGAGHTQTDGEYRQTVERGLAFLIASQASDGNLGADAEVYAFMYCHGMASFALSEAYAMTGEERFLDPLRKAIRYTVACQNRTTGGWRYRPGDKGDTSQLGWQLMALKSAELAGLEVPPECREGMVRFLQGVSHGRHSGLASYREGERATRAMTAEALVCRQFLGMTRDNPASNEAGDYLLSELPGASAPNLYYWYYGTLGMYQLQGSHWQRWNNALTQTLLASQETEGGAAGSWSPTGDVWGGHGGRVYTTAMGALCLEVYYRFLPLYVEAEAALRNSR